MLKENLMGQNYMNMLDTYLDQVSYSLCSDTSGISELYNKDMNYRQSFSSTVFKSEKPDVTNYALTNFFILPLLTALDSKGEFLNELYRIRIGLIFRTPKPYLHGEHVDYNPEMLSSDLKLRTGLYYVNETSGSTEIYKEKEYEKPRNIAKFNIHKKIKPVKNRWYDFDGRRYHSSTSPHKHNFRIVITYNYSIA